MSIFGSCGPIQENINGGPCPALARPLLKKWGEASGETRERRQSIRILNFIDRTASAWLEGRSDAPLLASSSSGPGRCVGIDRATAPGRLRPDSIHPGPPCRARFPDQAVPATR